MSNLTPENIKRIKYAYVAGQILSVGASFASPWIAIYDLNNPDQRGLESSFFYAGIAISSTLCGILGGYTALKFQGNKIGKGHDHDDTNKRFPADLYPRNWKSNFMEAGYLTFSTLLRLFFNYFLITALQVQYRTFINPDDTDPIEPLTLFSWGLFIFQTILVDLFFDFTNIDFEPAEEIKYSFTGSKSGALITSIVKPIAKPPLFKPAFSWICTAGVLSHTLSDYLGTLLSIPPTAYASLYTNHRTSFIAIAVVISIVSVPVLFFNYVQTLKFEAEESKENMLRVSEENEIYSRYPFLTETAKPSRIDRVLSNLSPLSKKIIRYGFYTHPFMHAGSDALPVILLLRDLFDRADVSTNVQIGVITPLALFVFASGWLGTLYSEVSEAIKHYKEQFEEESSAADHSRCSTG
ncbi:MAG: hypothetical protein KDH94_04410, partial [Coxiellaceae bacterium]|nr:hypothetical protein [Coxiellaceae bacterium]